MPTFFEVYTDCWEKGIACELSKNKYRKLHQGIKIYYEKWEYKKPIKYRKITTEAGEPREVRLYPIEFAAKMQTLIYHFCKNYQESLAKNTPQIKPDPPSQKRQRKRIPIPAYTTRK